MRRERGRQKNRSEDNIEEVIDLKFKSSQMAARAVRDDGRLSSMSAELSAPATLVVPDT